MKKIKIVPLSVNQVWAGRRFKTAKYKAYEQEMMYMLPKVVIPQGKLKITLVWGVSSKLADIDNPIKPFLDILQKKYNFDDKRIYELVVKKKDVKKGAEYIDFDIKLCYYTVVA